MIGSILTVEAAKSAGLEVVENGRYTQALHDTVVSYRAARRSGTASTKTKAEVNLSGAKPWRQKGTGRARAGYKSSPVWVGGGVVFGPKPRSYRKGLSKSVRQAALRKALSLRLIAGEVILSDGFEVTAGKTKDCVALMSGILGEVLPKTLLVIDASFSEKTFLAARNIEGVRLLRSDEVTAEDLLRSKKLIITKSGLDGIVKRANP